MDGQKDGQGDSKTLQGVKILLILYHEINFNALQIYIKI